MTIEDRITQLEAEVASIRRRSGTLFAFALIALSVPAALALRHGEQTVIRAEWFKVVKNGQTVAEISAGEVGGFIGVAGNDGKIAGGLSPGPDGGGLVIYNKDGKPVAQLLAREYGGALETFSKAGKPSTTLGASANGGWLGIANKDGNGVVFIKTDPDGVWLDILNNGSKTVATAIGPPVGGSFHAYSKDGKMVGVLVVTENGEGLVGVADKDGNVVGGMAATPDGGILNLRTPDGKVTFKAP
jgi:hypothetical protein